VASAASGEAAVGAYRNALALYLVPYSREISKHLRRQLQEQQGDAGEIQAALSRLDGIRAPLQGSLLDEAAKACREAEAVVAAPQMNSFGVTVGKKGAAPMGDVPELVLPLPFPPFPTTSEEADGALRQLRVTLGSIDWLYQGVVLLVAVMLGVYVLWADNPTWGSAKDMLIAGLWGLGLHSLSNNPGTYQGLADMTGKLR